MKYICKSQMLQLHTYLLFHLSVFFFLFWNGCFTPIPQKPHKLSKRFPQLPDEILLKTETPKFKKKYKQVKKKNNDDNYKHLLYCCYSHPWCPMNCAIYLIKSHDLHSTRRFGMFKWVKQPFKWSCTILNGHFPSSRNGVTSS